MINRSHIHILGGGLAGSLLALHLAESGHAVEVFEKRPDLRSGTAPGGRSINLALSARGIAALDRVGLAESVLPLTIPMRGRMIHDVDETTHFQAYSHDPDEFIRSVSRADLNRKLLEASAEFPDIRLHFNVSCDSVVIRERAVSYVSSDSRDEGSAVSAGHAPDVLFGADGAGSVLREAMVTQASLTTTLSPLGHGYKELTIGPNPDGSPQLELQALHIWPRGNFMLIALPNLDHSFTCTLFLPNEGTTGFSALESDDEILRFMQMHFPDAFLLMDSPVEQFRTNPTGLLGTIRCSTWHVNGSACLIGDAAHAIVPFFGQGMNCALEDCTVLRDILDARPDTWASAFSDFSATRIPDANAIADMALENYLEMRDHVNSKDFQLRKQVGLALAQRYPDQFTPRYSLVSFRTIPYAEAKRRGEIQDRILTQLTRNASELNEIDWSTAGKLINELL